MKQRGNHHNRTALKAALVFPAGVLFPVLWQVFSALAGRPMLFGPSPSRWALSLIAEPAFWLSVCFIVFMFAKGTLKRIVKILLIAAFWFAVWQAAAIATYGYMVRQGAAVTVNSSLLMPSPAETFTALAGLIVQKNFWISLGATFYRVAVGLAASFVSGVLLALLASRSLMLQSLLRPVVAAIKSTPVVSIIVLALVWFSSSFVPIFSCVLLCFPIFFANTLSGIQTVDKGLLELAAVYRVRRGRVVREIVMPSVLPNVYSATSICLGFSWKSVVAAEVLSSPQYSMGFELYKTKLYLKTPELFAWTVAIIVISIVVEKGLKQLMPRGSAI
jgi:ABC-type nitrate/sulfonate/bicarbonate transport system, permease component